MRSDQPLAPGEVRHADFAVSARRRTASATATSRRSSRTTERSSTRDTFRRSATTRAIELDDPRRRREEHLGPLEEMAQRGDPVHSRDQSVPAQLGLDYVSHRRQHVRTIRSPSRRVICSATWQQDGRHYYEYSMGSTHILDFYRVSCRRAMRRARRSTQGPNGPVNLEVYYDPAHTYNIDDMLASVAGWPRLLPDALQSVSVHAVSHHGVSALSQLRAVFPEHGAVLGRNRLHQPGAEEGRCRSDLLRDGARTGPSMVGPSVDRRRRCRART